MPRRRVAAAMCLAAALSGCAAPAAKPALSDADRQRILEEELGRAEAQPAPEAPGPAPRAEAQTDPLAARVTVTGVGVPLHAVLAKLAEAAGLRLVLDRDVDPAKPVTVALRDARVGDALRVVLAPLAYYARVSGDELVVYAFDVRVWSVPLPAIASVMRTEISNSTQGGAPGPASGQRPCAGAQAGAPAAPSAGGPGQMAGVNLGAAACVGTASELSGWDELERALRAYLSPEGTLTINRAVGLVTVRERPDRLAQIDQFLAQYNAAVSQQVVVSVRAIEVGLSASDRYGIDWSRVWRAVGNTAVGLGGAFAPLPSAAPFSLTISEPGGVQVLIRALSTQGKVKVLNQPSVRLVHGLPAVIQIGRVQTFLASASTTISGAAALTTSSLQLGSVQDGVILPITAYVTGGDVVLTLAPVISRVRQIRTIVSGNTVVEAPDLDNRAVQTTVRLRSGETVVLGGFLSNADTDERRGLPLLLRSIPVFGWLFGSLDQRAERTEVVLTLTPTILGQASRPQDGPAPARPAGAWRPAGSNRI